MEQNPIEIEFEGNIYQFLYFYSPPQDQEQEHVKLIFQSSFMQQIGFIIVEHIQADFHNLQQFYDQLEKDRLDQQYKFRIVRELETNIVWFNYFVNVQIGTHNEEFINIFVQLQQQDRLEDYNQYHYRIQLKEIQTILDRNPEIVGQAEKSLQSKESLQYVEQYENEIKVMDDKLNEIKTNIGQVKPIIEELQENNYVKIEDVPKLYSQFLEAIFKIKDKKKLELKTQDGFAISQAFSDRQKLKFKIEDIDKNITFGICPGDANYESVNQIMNKDQVQYFFTPKGDYKHGQKVYNNHLKHFFGDDDTITLIVDPSIRQIGVKINNVLLTNIRNQNMAQSYKIFISVKDQQNLKGIIL